MIFFVEPTFILDNTRAQIEKFFNAFPKLIDGCDSGLGWAVEDIDMGIALDRQEVSFSMSVPVPDTLGAFPQMWAATSAANSGLLAIGNFFTRAHARHPVMVVSGTTQVAVNGDGKEMPVVLEITHSPSDLDFLNGRLTSV